MHLRFASLAVVLSSVLACSSPPSTSNTTEQDSEVVGDAGDDTELDSSTEDSSAGDTTVVDTGGTMMETSTGDSKVDTYEASTTCTEVGGVESESCGKCGKRARLCNSDGTWLPWGACTGEKGFCTPGEMRSSKCGKCGTRTETCSTSCTWDPGACTGEGLCNAGDSEVQYGACSLATYVKTRTCSDTTCMWSDWSACQAPKGWVDMAAAPSTFYGRQYHNAVWTGTEMIVFGGQSSGSSYANDAAAYNLSTNTWRTLTTATITGRYNASAVWTGTEMIVFGGYGTPSPYSKADGAAFNPTLNTWTVLPAVPTGFNARDRHTAVWTGTEMIIWGGYYSGGATYLADGAAYNPTTKAWRLIKAAPLVGRYNHTAVYAGGKMIVFGGYGTSCTSYYCADAAAYDPVADTWTSLTPPSTDLDGRYQAGGAADSTGKQAIFWGGYGSYVSSAYYRNTGAIFDTATSTWKSITVPAETVLPYSRRWNMSVWASATSFFVWGGSGYNATGSSTTAATGAYYDFASSTWKAMSDTNAPTARYAAPAVWTGTEAIIWGGYSYKNDGKIYRP
jgi:N-acetylneuraminic acid mutarotase